MGLFGKDGLFGGPNTTSPNEILLPSGKILVGNPFGRAQAQYMSGQGVMDNLGALTLQGSPTFDKVTVFAAPTVSTDLTNKAYVDMFASGLFPLAACRVATTAALTATYSNGTAGVGATLTNAGAQAAISIDTISLSLNDRVAVKNQAAPAQNGIYTVTTVGSGATNWVLTRSTDFDTSAEMREGSSTFITSGTANPGNINSTYFFTTSQPIVVGTTALTFELFTQYGTMANQNANAVAITGGSISGTSINIGDAPVITGILPNANTTSEIYNGGGNTPNSIVQRDADGLARANLADESSSAFQVITDSDTLNTAAHLAFVNNSGAGTQSIYNNSNLLYNAVTNTISANVAGNATLGKILNLTSNGFVKTSSSDGTLSVDTNTYLNINGGTLLGALTLNADPSTALQAATKSYVDNLVTGLTWKTAVIVKTTGNITLSGEQTIGGILTSQSRVLVGSQTNQTENGLWLSSSGAWTRTTDADTGAELAVAAVYVGAGTFAGTQWACSNTTITIGVTNVIFAQIAGAGVYTNGTGITLTGNVFSIGSGAITNAMLAGSIADSNLSTISTAGKVANSATTATSANTTSAIVARDGSGNFTAGTITATAVTINNGGAALTGATTPFTFGSALGNGTYINYGGTARNTGVTDTGSLFHARNAFFNATSAAYLYGASGSGVTLLELSDTAINLKYAASGTLGNPITFTTGYSLSQSTGLSTLSTANINNGIAALTGTNAALIFGATNALGDGNYINFGTGGRNIGVFNLGAFFITNNADYNATSDVYKYNSSAGATMMEFSTTSIDFKYAASGTAGNTITTTTSLSLSQANGNVTASTGHLIVNTAGKTIEIKEGSNACKGTGAVLVAGAVTVSTTAVATGDMVNVSRTAVGGTIGTGMPTVTISNGTSFTLTSSNPLDTSTYSWWIVKAA